MQKKFSVVLSNLAIASEYTEAFPTYYEYCTATQLKYSPKYFDGSTGGIGGHGLIYVEGLCKDTSVAYPRVIPCEKSGEGVGISLDSDFKNVKWVAIPGRELFYNGTHNKKDISPLGINELESVKEVAYSLEVFKGVELKSLDSIDAKAGSREYEMAAAEWAIGTDIALDMEGNYVV